MRPIKLKIRAFQSYLDETEIDFSEFDPNSIFLIDGKTGAGKSTLFQAMFFALYGVPVDSNLKSFELRSLDAPDDVETKVEFTFESQGKTYRVERTPRQKLKKKRGEGTTDYYPTAFLYLIDASGEKLLKSSHETVTDYIQKELLHLTGDQFQSVVLIPQGAFRKVLVDPTDSRCEIYREIFHTDLYKKLVDKMKQRADKANTELGDSKNRIDSEFASLNLSIDPASPFIERHKGLSAPSSAFSDRIDLLNEAHNWYRNLESDADAEVKTLSDKQRELDSSIAQKTQFDNWVEEKAYAENKIDELTNSVNYYSDLLNKREAQKPEIDEKRNRGAAIQARMGDYNRIESLQKTLEQNRTDFKALTDRKSHNDEELKKEEKIFEDATNSRAAITEDPVRALTSLQGQFEEVQNLNNLVAEAGSLIAQIDEIDERLGEAQGERLRAQEENDRRSQEFSDIWARFIESSSAILAEELENGKPCPVCGGIDHPHPAIRTSDTVTSAQVDEAREKLNESGKALSAADQKLKNVEAEKQKLLDQAADKLRDYGAKADDLNSIRSAHMEVKKEASKRGNALELEQSRINDLDQQIKELDSTIKSSREQVDKLRAEQSLLDTQIANTDKEGIRLNGDINDLKKTLPYPTRDEANQETEQLRKEIEDFDRVLKNVHEKLSESSSDLAKNQGTLQTLEKNINLLPANVQSIDLDDLKKQQKDVEDQLKEAKAAQTIAHDTLRECDRVKRDLEAEVKVSDAKQKETDRLKDLYNILAGQLSVEGGKMDIETFVQTRFLDAVLVRANKTLSKITNGRYRLERSTGVIDGRKSTGLDINAFDYYQGKGRRVDSLSGGESFQASLALALGLADIVSEQAGATRIECMFIDEGFGSLDSESLNALIPVLSVQTAKNGQVMVGIISHVEELRQQIRNRIEVKQDALGHSTARIVMD